MTSTINKKSKIELKIQRGIRHVEDDLVTYIQDALDKTKYGDLKSSQFRNLVQVSYNTESAEVIKNFIRYQVGRDNKWGKGKNSLAEQIIKDIDSNIKKHAQEIQEAAKAQDFKPIWLSLIRLYLGYGALFFWF